MKLRRKITSKGQITVPLAIRKRLGLRTGQELEFDENSPFLRATKVIDESAARSTIGLLKKELVGSVDEILENLRGPVDLP